MYNLMFSMGERFIKSELNVAYTKTITDQVNTIGVISNITGIPIANTTR